MWIDLGRAQASGPNCFVAYFYSFLTYGAIFVYQILYQILGLQTPNMVPDFKNFLIS